MNDNKMLNAIGSIDEKYYMDVIPGKYEKSITSFRNRFINIAAAAFAVILIGGTSVYAYYKMTNRTEVNQEQLPSIGEMKCVEEWDFHNVDEKKIYPDYNRFADLTGLKLLDSTLSESNPYMQVMVETDKKDFAIIRVENYILGDTTNYQLVEDINRYNCDPGDKYKSSISLKIDLILSKDQLETGFDTEYLGYYEYCGTYKTADGMSVNMISEKVPNAPADLVSKKIAIFVRDGIKYTLAGRVSTDEMKHIVETMK